MKYIKAFEKINNTTFRTGGIGGSKETIWKLKERKTTEGKPILCENGFHFYKKQNFYFGVDLFGKKTCFCEIKAHSKIVEDTEKCVSCDIEIIRFIPKKEWMSLLDSKNNAGNYNTGSYNTGRYNSGDCNAGYRNAGDCNTGHRNTGHRNTGHRNTGHRNTGDCNTGNCNIGNRNTGDCNTGNCNIGNRNTGNCNTGNWNKCNLETGFFNTKQPKEINVFGKKCKSIDWDRAQKPSFIYFKLLKNKSYKESFQTSYNNLSEEEKVKQTKQLKALPNFDANIFFEISGIRIS